MGFIAPGALIVGLGLLALVLATYLLRPRRPVRRISSTFLWLAALNDLQAAKPWRRVPPSVILLLQLLAVAAISLALARPFALSADSSGPYSVVLLDGSASMQATDIAPSRFEAAKARARQLIDQLESGQQLGLVSLDAEPRVLAPPTSDRAALTRALETAHATAEAANLPAALSVAGTLVEGHADAQILLISDGSIDRAQLPQNPPAPVRIVGIGSQNAANLAVAGLGTRAAQGRLSALARVVNYGPQPQTATLTLKVDGSRFDAKALTIDPGKSADATWDDLPPNARTLEARLDQSDGLALDNAAWAVMGADRPTRILLVSDGNVFVERALTLRPSTQVTRVSPSDYSLQNQAYDLVVLDGYVPPVLPTGSSVLLLHPPQGNAIIGSGPDLSISAINAAKPDDPLLKDVPLGSVHIVRSRRIEPPPWADIVAQSPETPLLLVGEQAGRRIGTIGFDVHQSDLPLQPGFPVLMQHLLDWLVPTSSTATPVVQVGQAVSLALLPETVSASVITPDAQQIPVAPPLPAPPFAATTQPGLYQVVQRDDRS
ncbi:MAG TPA: VWA domain-containing protein, partial [Roseiflexaceae bacterium]